MLYSIKINTVEVVKNLATLLNINNVIERLSIINPDVKILSKKYINAKENLECECLICFTLEN